MNKPAIAAADRVGEDGSADAGLDTDLREPTMTLTGWRRFVDAPAASIELLPEKRWKALPAAARQSYDEARLTYHSEMIIVATSAVRAVARQGRLLTLLNRREISARRGLIVSGPQTTGKTTALKQLGRTHELMVRQRSPGRLTDRIPVVYVTTPPKGSPRKLAMEFARFLGLPPVKRGYNTTDIADAVCQIMLEARVDLVLVDELHNLNLATAAGEDMSDHLKYFTEHLPATFVYAGIDVERRLFTGVRGKQIAGRCVLVNTGPFPCDAEWKGLVVTLEDALRLHRHEPGTLTRQARYLHRRTGGMIGSLSHLVRAAAQLAILEGDEGHHPQTDGQHPRRPRRRVQPIRRRLMFPFGSRLAPPLLLPRPIPPFRGETTNSYLYRLAVANHVHPDDLRAHLTGTRGRASITVEDLAAATGRSAHDLSYALPELRPDNVPGADPPIPVHVRRTICWRCAVRRDAFVFAVTWTPAEVTLCPNHRIWLGLPGRSHRGRQYDVRDLPDILHAQRRHHRLARHYGRQTIADAFADAAHITAFWARHGQHDDRRKPLISAFLGHNPLTSRLPSGDPITPVVTYPETVDLARVLAMPRWRHPAGRATKHDLRQFRRDISDHLRIHYRPQGNSRDPLIRWFQKRHAPRSP